MATLRTAIVDDEKPARDRIRDMLASHADVDVVCEAESGAQALRQVREMRPSLVFLDVQMPELDGFGVLHALEPEERPAAIVFVTAYDTHAIRAFEVNAIDYLLKPYTAERFNDALRRARARLQTPGAPLIDVDALLRTLAERKTASERLAIKTRDDVRFVRADEIDWLQSDGNYTIVHAGSNALRTRETLADLETRLMPSGFMRIHRSIVVNLDRVFRLEPWAHGEYVLVLRNGTKLNSGRAYGERIRALFQSERSLPIE